MKLHVLGSASSESNTLAAVYDSLKKLGHTPLAVMPATDEKALKTDPVAQKKKAREIEKYIKKAEIVVFEATHPDINIGYEISLALNLLKSVIVLHKKESEVILRSLSSIQSDKLQVLSYDDDSLTEVLEEALLTARDALDVRFNFFISPAIAAYLDWMAKIKKIPRSVYLRSLIESQILENEEYQQHQNS